MLWRSPAPCVQSCNVGHKTARLGIADVDVVDVGIREESGDSSFDVGIGGALPGDEPSFQPIAFEG